MRDDTVFSFVMFAGLEIKSDNARSHAPFPFPSRMPVRRRNGLTRWGSKDDIISQKPKPPCRGSSLSPPPRKTSPISCPGQPSSQHWSASASTNASICKQDDQMHPIRSRWNSQLCRDDGSMGKLTFSPTKPRRFLDDALLPIMDDNNDDDDLTLHAPADGTAWKRTLQEPLKFPSWKLPERSPLNASPA